MSSPMTSDFEFRGLGLGVDGGRLDEVPVAQQVHHVVVPDDVRLQDLTGAGVVHVGAHGVLDVGRHVADHAE